MKTKLLIALILIGITAFTSAKWPKNLVLESTLIGKQEWATTNLDISTFQNGDNIQQATTQAEWIKYGKEHKPAWCVYNFDPSNTKKYGKLYNFYAIIDPRGLAPKGWHVPSREEWDQLIQYLGEPAAGLKIKAWGNDQGKNSTGFSALPGGYCSGGKFFGEGQEAKFWTATQYDNLQGSAKGLNDWFKIFGGHEMKNNGYSCRCVKD